VRYSLRAAKLATIVYPAVATAKPRVLARENFNGVFIQLGSVATAEMASRAGFDFVLLDQEHGLGSEATTLAQLQAVSGSPTCVPIVRLAVNEPHLFKRALDAGACGIMVPWVEDAAGAVRAAAAMHYPPHGVRGLAKTTRATNFGAAFDEYFDNARARLLLVAQIETAKGVAAAAEIAAVEGVDVLFVGPTDLGCSLAGGKPLAFDDPQLATARRAVADAARAAGKAAGILCMAPEHIPVVRGEGFSFVMLGEAEAAAHARTHSAPPPPPLTRFPSSPQAGSDASAAATGLRGFAAALRK
jgi:4-hydroxy-2-oxoheptanedioate aldolase